MNSYDNRTWRQEEDTEEEVIVLSNRVQETRSLVMTTVRGRLSHVKWCKFQRVRHCTLNEEFKACKKIRI